MRDGKPLRPARARLALAGALLVCVAIGGWMLCGSKPAKAAKSDGIAPPPAAVDAQTGAVIKGLRAHELKPAGLWCYLVRERWVNPEGRENGRPSWMPKSNLLPGDMEYLWLDHDQFRQDFQFIQTEGEAPVCSSVWDAGDGMQSGGVNGPIRPASFDGLYEVRDRAIGVALGGKDCGDSYFLLKQQAKVIGQEQVGGRQCYLLESRSTTPETGKKYVIRAWLAPDLDMSVVQLDVIEERPDGRNKSERRIHEAFVKTTDGVFVPTSERVLYKDLQMGDFVYELAWSIMIDANVAKRADTTFKAPVVEERKSQQNPGKDAMLTVAATNFPLLNDKAAVASAQLAERRLHDPNAHPDQGLLVETPLPGATALELALKAGYPISPELQAAIKAANVAK